MLNNGLDAASAAFEVGYESATQFSREYSRFSVSRQCEILKQRFRRLPRLKSLRF